MAVVPLSLNLSGAGRDGNMLLPSGPKYEPIVGVEATRGAKHVQTLPLPLDF